MEGTFSLLDHTLHHTQDSSIVNSRRADESAVASRQWLSVTEQAVQRYLDVTQLAGHPGSPNDDLAPFDHPTAQSRAHDRRHRRAQGCLIP